MKTLFKRGPSLESRTLVMLSIAISLIIADGVYNLSQPMRVGLNTLVYPIRFLASLPGDMLKTSSSSFQTQQTLRSQREALIDEIMVLREKVQRYDVLEAENRELRSLLDAPLKTEFNKTIAELIGVDNNLYSQQVIINKGALDGVFQAQPVLDNDGIVGQIIDVAPTNSRVLLITDVSHAIPVRVLRNNVSLIVNGSGLVDQVNIRHVPHSADLKVGDVLISSGLGEVFPQGYPVAVIESIKRDESLPFAEVNAAPLANLDRLRYLLLLSPLDSPLQEVTLD